METVNITQTFEKTRKWLPLTPLTLKIENILVLTKGDVNNAS